MSRLTVSEVDIENEVATPTIIAITITPETRTYLFIIRNNVNWLKKLIPNCERIFV